MFEIIKSGGWLMLPLILCSVGAIAIIAERFWSLRHEKVLPKHLVATIWASVKNDKLVSHDIEELGKQSALGKVLTAGLINRDSDRNRIKESIEEQGREVIHELDQFLDSLGTIAAISPLIGLLGTVIGMIKVFSQITLHGVGNPGILADGISQALITTATGLSIAIFSLVFYRYFRRRVDTYVVEIEREAIKMVDVLHNYRNR